MSSNPFRPEVQAILGHPVWQQILDLDARMGGKKNRIIFKDMAEYGTFQAMLAQGFGHVVHFVDLVAYEQVGKGSHPWGSNAIQGRALRAMQEHHPVFVLILEDQLEDHRLACEGMSEFEFEFRFSQA